MKWRPGLSNVRWYAGLFLLAALPRLAYLCVARPFFTGVYWAAAGGLLYDGSLAVEGTKTTALEPLYPLFLAVSRFLARDHLFLVQVFQVAIASLGAVYLYRLAEVLTGRPWLAAISAFFYAVDPLLVRQAGGGSDLALATTLLVAFSYVFVSATTTAGAAVAGVLLGLVVLTRTMAVPLVALGAGVLIADRRHPAALAMAVAAVVLIVPFPIRNHSVDGSWWPTRSGLNLFEGNSPYTPALLPTYDLDILAEQSESFVAHERPDLSAAAPEYEHLVDIFLTRRALAYMAERPLRTLYQKMWNVAYFFSPRLVPFRVSTPDTRLAIGPTGRVTVENSAPRPLVEEITYSVFHSFVLVTALIGVYLRRHNLRRDAILWCVAATFVAVHVMYFPATRYRGPMEFVLLFYAAVTLERWSRGCRDSENFEKTRSTL